MSGPVHNASARSIGEQSRSSQGQGNVTQRYRLSQTAATSKAGASQGQELEHRAADDLLRKAHTSTQHLPMGAFNCCPGRDTAAQTRTETMMRTKTEQPVAPTATEVEFNRLSFQYGWEYGRGQSRVQEEAEIQSAQARGLVREYMACQFHARASGLVPYDYEEEARQAA